MAKTVKFLANVTKGSTRVVVDSSTDLTNLKPNSLIRVGDSDYFYAVRKIEEVRIVKEFTVVDPFNIKIEDCNNIFVKGDYIDISTKEFELQTIERILSENILFNNGEVVSIEGGKSSMNTFDGQYQDVKLKYLNSKNLFQILEKGKYIIPPLNPVKVYSNESQNYILVDLLFKESDERKIQDRNVINVINTNKTTSILTLDVPIDSAIKNGKISMRKHYITLRETYEEQSENNVLCFVQNDFTPHLNLPLVTRNSSSHELFQNEAFLIIDEKIKEIESQIKKLINP